jgi:hypothetical protein
MRLPGNRGSNELGAKGRAVMACCLVLALFGILAPAANAAHSGGHLLARARITPRGGGDVFASGGWNLYVPAGVVHRAGYGYIVRTGQGQVVVGINAPWRGRVEVTVPLRNRSEVVAHYISGLWVPEGTAVGQSTVWVTHLSLFSVSSILHKVEDFLCLTAEDPYDFAGCLIGKGIQWIAQTAAVDLLGKVTHSCSAAIVASGLLANSKGMIPVSALKSALSNSACRSSAGETNTSTGGSSGPTLPVSSTPVSGSGLQGPTANPQGPTSNPQGGASGGSSPPTPQPPSPPTTPPPTSGGGTPEPTEGFFIEDDIYGGTWARTDPNDGTWYPHSTPPPNGAYWYPNGLGVAVSCSEPAAAYEVVVYGVHGTWNWWAHVTDGKWVPTVVFSTVWNDGQLPGLPVC